MFSKIGYIHCKYFPKILVLQCISQIMHDTSRIFLSYNTSRDAKMAKREISLWSFFLFSQSWHLLKKILKYVYTFLVLPFITLHYLFIRCQCNSFTIISVSKAHLCYIKFQGFQYFVNFYFYISWRILCFLNVFIMFFIYFF